MRHRSRTTFTLAAALAALLLLAPASALGEPDASTASGESSLSAPRLVARPGETTPSADEEDPSTLDGKARNLSEAPANASVAAISDVPCEDGRAGPYTCQNVDLLSLVTNAELGGANGNDLWGWTDPETGDEYAIMGTGYGTTFIDVTEPTEPVVVAYVPTEGATYLPLWRDIKVYDDHAFIVSEHDFHGVQVVDLTQLRDLGAAPTVITPDAVYDEFSHAHNIAINTDSGFAYVVGTDTCDGGLHMVDINEPQEPDFAGCFGEDGYTHDVQCVNYDGPNGRYDGRELCFASNGTRGENSVAIVDVTDKDDPQLLSRTEYETAGYTHQGWLTPDHRWFIFGDELDEMNGTVENTTTYIMDVSNPAKPGQPVPYFHETESIDHNLYVDDRFVYQANYTAGLRILGYDDELLANGQLDEVAYFDVAPEVDISEFAGAWSNYPYFESGTVVVSTIEQGLFVLGPDLPDDESDDGDEKGKGNGPPDDKPGKGPPDDRGNGKPANAR